jgi:hypothetical protein
LLLLGAIAFGAFYLNGEARKLFDRVKASTVARLEAAVNRSISYDAVSPAVFRALEMEGLTVHGLDGEPPVLLEINRIRVRYRMLDLIRGDLSRALSGVDIRGATIHIRENRDDDVRRFLSDLISELGESGSALGSAQGDARTRRTDAQGIRLGGEEISVSYVHGDGSYRVEDLAFAVTLSPAGVEVEAEGRARLEGGGALGGAGYLSSRVFVDGRVGSALRDGTATLRLQGARSGLFQAAEQTFRVDMTPERVVVRKVRDRAPLDLSAEYDRERGRVEARFEAAGFRPGNAVQLSGAWTEGNQWLNSQLFGTGSFSAKLAQGSGSSDGSDEMGLTRIGAASYDLDLRVMPDHPALPGDARLELDGAGDLTSLRIEGARLRIGEGSASFSGEINLAQMGVSGVLSLRDFSYAEYGPLSGSVDVESSAGAALALSSRALVYKRATLFDLTVDASLDSADGGVPWWTAEQAAASGLLQAEISAALAPDGTSQLSINAGLPLAGPGSLRAEVRLSGIDGGRAYKTVRDLGVVTDLPTRVEEIEGLRIDAYGRLEFAGGDDYDLRVPFLSVYDREEPRRGLYASLELAPQRLRVGALSMHAFGIDAHGTVEAETLQGGLYRIQTALRTDRGDFDIRGTYRAGRSAVLTINEEVVLRGYAMQSGDILLRARADRFRIAPASGSGRIGAVDPEESGGVTLSFEGTGVLRSLGDWSASLRGLRLEGSSEPTGDFVAESNLRLTPDGGGLTDVNYEDLYSSLSGEGEVQALEEGYRLGMSLSDEPGEESYDLVARWVEDNANGQVDFEGMSLRRLQVPPVRGSADGVLSIREIPERPQFSLRVQTRDADFNADGFQASGVLTGNSSALELRDFELQYLTSRLREGRGAVDLEEGKARFEFLLEDRAGGGPDQLDFAFTGQVDQKALPMDAAGIGAAPFEGRLEIGGIELAAVDDSSWLIDVSRSEDGFRLLGGPQGSISGRVAEDGDFHLDLTEPLPLRFRGEGRLKAGDIEATLTNAYFDVAQLPRIFDFGTVRLTAGEAGGSLRIVGPVNDPDFFGTFRATGVEGELDYIPDTLGPAEGFLVFEEKVLNINPLRIPAGSGGAEFSGSATLQRWNIDEFRFQVETGEEESVPVDYRSADLVAQGRAQGDLKIQGVPGVTDVTGELAVFDTAITLGDPEFALAQPEDVVTNVDVTLTTRGRVEFLWPSRDLPVLRAFADRGQSVRIVSRSNPEEYSVKGSVAVQGGEIYYFDRSFFIREGSITFDESEEEFDPRLQARAEVREVSAQGPVRIFLIVEQERLSNLTPRLESSPPLSTEEIVGILGRDFLAGGDGGVNVSSALLLPADVLQLAVLSRLESGVRDALGLDLLSVRTQVLENVVAGAGAAATGRDGPLDTTQTSFGEYLNNTTLFLGKYVGADLFFETLFEVGRTAPNEQALVNIGDVGFGAEVGLEWQTPFFRLNWSFAPRHPETLFVTDTSFELSWGFSY